MDLKVFDDVVQELPFLTADGFMSEDDPEFAVKRGEFLNSPLYPEEVEKILDYLSKIGKSERFSNWQRENCDPQHLQKLFSWRAGQDISVGSIIAASVSLGFTMGVTDHGKVYFNFSADAIESDLARLRSLEQIAGVVADSELSLDTSSSSSSSSSSSTPV